MAQKGETMNMVPIDGDINKSVQVIMALETAGEEAVSDDLYAKLHAWLTESIQQERNHWRKKMDAILQEMEHQRKDALSMQGSLQQLLERINGTGGNIEQPTNDGRELTSASNFNEYYQYEEKENLSTEQLIESLGAVIDTLKAEIVTLQESLNAKLMQAEQNLPSTGKTELQVAAMATVEAQTQKSSDENPSRSHPGSYDGHARPVSTERSQRHAHENWSGSHETMAESDKEGKDNVTPIKTMTQRRELGLDSMVTKDQGSGKSLRSSSQITKMADPGETKADEDEGKSASSGQGRTSVPITTCQVWSINEEPGSRARRSTKDSGEHTQRAIVRPFLRKGAADNKDKFSVKKLTSLAHEEKQQYERKIQGKNKEIKVLQSELEHATSKVQKLQRVIERLYFLQKTLKNSANVSPGPEDIEEQGSKTERRHVSSKILSDSMPSLSNLPMFQPMAGDEIALWKLRIKRQNPKATKLSKSHVAQCLRCQRLFRPSDNTPVACRFHSKGQESIEKYDNHGRLVRVVYKWGCCNRSPDAPGCTHGLHM